ncbi:MAG: hypothetical protein ACYTG1_04320 [Planctomycetota bacterium]
MPTRPSSGRLLAAASVLTAVSATQPVIGRTPPAVPAPPAPAPAARAADDAPTDPAPVAPDADAARATVAAGLVELGHTPEQAAAAAAQLTEADLAVLVGNPRMMQTAGGNEMLVILIGAALIAGLIAIAASSDGSVSINA